MHPLLSWQLAHFGLAIESLPAKVAELLRAVESTYQQAEAASKYAEKLALVASRTDNAVIITDVNGLIEWVNDGFTRISGYALDEVIGKKPGSFLQGPDTDPLTVEFMRQQLARGEGFKTEILNYAKDGRRYWLGIEVQPIYDSGGELRNFMAIESDITARKQVEQELQQAKEQAEAASKSKSEFLANMSHEIRTPLNGVIGMTDLLLGTELAQQQRRYVQIAKSSADALLVVINQILDFSKIEAGKLELESIDFNLGTVLEDVGEMMAHRAASKGLELAYRIDPAVPTALRGDSARLRQVLINLVNNAVKFTHKGEVIVHVSLESRNDPQTVLRFAVQDSGIGISADRLDRLFKAFSQVDASTTRKYGGTGLGLAICKQLAELMGGQIGVSSEEGRGSTFWFTASFAVRAPEAKPAAPHELEGLRVLVVDDNASVRQILVEQLATWGLRAGEASNGAEAVQRLRHAATERQPYHIAVFDMGMPGMTGLRLAELVKAEPALRNTAAVLLTSLEAPVTPQAVRAAGLCDSVTKPLRQSQLFDAIVRAGAVARGGALPPAALPAENNERKPLAAFPARVLVAEDNEVNQLVASEILTRAGFRCDIVGDGRRAVDQVEKERYDVVLMDCQMPEMDGFLAATTIRRREAERAKQGKPVRWLPIIALTANALKGDREKCLAAGMDEYLSKPLDGHQLIETLNRVLAGARPAPPSLTQESIAPAGAPPILDMQSLLARCMGDDAFRDRLLEKFPQQAQQAVEKIADAVSAADAQQLAQAAHALKGTAANLSAVAVQQAAAEVEALGKSGVLTEADRLLGELRAEVERCIAVIERHCELQNANLKLEIGGLVAPSPKL